MEHIDISNLSLFERFKLVDEILKDPFDSARYAIHKELDGFLSCSPEETIHLISLGIEAYNRYDYATPVGVGCALRDFIVRHFEEDESERKPLFRKGIEVKQILDVTIDDFEPFYSYSDWH